MWQSKWEALDKWSQVSLTFGTYVKPLSHKVKHFSDVCIRNQIWPCHKIGQGQARFIICAKLVKTTSPMLHSKSKGHLFQRIKYLKGFYHIWVWWPWPLKLSYSHCLIRFNISSENVFGFNSNQNINFSKKFPFKCIRKQIWPWH